MNRLESALTRQNSQEVDGTVLISVLSGKGGVGKSVVAFNLAERLVSIGARVLLVDADFATGNIHVLANLNSEYGIAEFSDGRLSLVEAVRPFAPNLDILTSAVAGPSGNLGSIGSAIEIARKLRRQATGYDLVILDHGSGISDPATVLANASDLNLLLLVPELTSIADCYGLFKYLKTANSAVKCALLLNRVRNEEESEYVRTKFSAVAERFLGEVPSSLGALSEDDSVRQSIAGQRPVSTVDPDCQIVRDLSAAARMLADRYLRSNTTGYKQKININAAEADTRG